MGNIWVTCTYMQLLYMIILTLSTRYGHIITVRTKRIPKSSMITSSKEDITGSTFNIGEPDSAPSTSVSVCDELVNLIQSCMHVLGNSVLHDTVIF